MPQAAMPQEKQGWDTRAWLVGILGGAVGGSITAWATYSPFVKPINAALHSANGSSWVCGCAGVLSLLVLPGVVSGISRRRTFLWGALPLVLFLIATDVQDWVGFGASHVAQEFWVTLLVIGGCLLVSSGPVSAIRYGRVRARRRREAAVAALAAQREAASIPQEGIWPPPPDYRK